jgi:dolichol-phosphate mannosyltransferase
MPELAIVIPTYNERENLPVLLEALEVVLQNTGYEVLVLDDDSEDGTAEFARQLSYSRPYLRVIQRIRRKGLSSAVIEGMMATSARYIAVMDADLQHDETILPKMLEKLRGGNLDLVIGSRNLADGSMGEFARERLALSRMGGLLSRVVCRAEITDPMSGFFMVERRFVDEVVRRLNGTGFKILLDLIASSPRRVRFDEVGYRFRNRRYGDSKLDLVVGLEFVQLILDKLIGDWIPIAYGIFGLVGALGVGVNLALAYVLARCGLDFVSTLLLSSSLVITLNFFLNNALTFRSRRLKGVRIPIGLVMFYLICSVGLFTNLRIATALSSTGMPSFVAGAIGIGSGSIWNYGMSSLLIWSARRKLARYPASFNNLSRVTR